CRPAMALGSQLRDVIDGFSELTAHHIRLARVELAQDARFIGVRVGVIAALAPLILVGYGFLCVALALVLRRVMSADLAFALVGLVNLVGGIAGIVVAARQLNEKKVMHETLTELEETSSLVVRREDGDA
ncbi:MAG: phage holin family protein, partial [Myxococcaceae bacterium]|nr:phage holin family protein [Myxococcaceae bacterium]